MEAVFHFKARVVRWIDGDTVLTDPLISGTDEYLRIRLKDAYAPEIGGEGADEATRRAEADFPPGCYIVATNDRHHWTYERLEARIDPA